MFSAQNFRNGHRWLIGLALLLVFTLAAACGSDATSTPTRTAGPTPTPTATLAPGETPTSTPTQTSATATPTAKPVDFSGQTINIIVGFAPGGGFDTFSRILAVHMKEHLPGHPNVIVSNLPGADTVVAAKQVANHEPKEGKIEIANIISSTVLNMVFGNVEGLSVDDFAFIGLPDETESDITLCGRASVVSGIDDMMSSGKTYTAAGLGGTTNYDLQLKGAQALGLPIDMVWGYAGSSELIAAFNRGEVDTTPSCRDADVELNPHWLSEDYIVPLLIFDKKPNWLVDAQASGKWPDVPTVLDFNPDADPAILQAVKANQTLGRATRVYAVNPETPDDVVAALRSGMEQIVNSQAFIDDMKQRGYETGWMSGAEYDQTLQEVLNMPPAGLEALKALFAPAE